MKWKIWLILLAFRFPSKGIPITPQHSDPHPWQIIGLETLGNYLASDAASATDAYHGCSCSCVPSCKNFARWHFVGSRMWIGVSAS